MKKENITARISKIHNGTWFKLTYASELDRYLTAAAKRSGHSVTKICTGTFRKGISYANQKAVITKVEKTGVQPSGELPWGSWVEGSEGLLIEHKGETYIRLYSGPNKTKSTYYLDGRKISYEELKSSGLIQNSYLAKNSEKPLCLTIKCANIIAL